MTIRTSSEAIAKAQGQTRNVPGTCQLAVRTWFNAPSAGDQDHDGDADAVDGWKSEPLHARHVGDRNPPRGKPLAFKGGSHGFGHRALSGVDSVFSTDMYNNRYRAGYTSRVTGGSTSDAIAKIERAMGVDYVGWSETIDGYPIPKEVPVLVRPKRVPAEWRTFKHLDPTKYMNYRHALMTLGEGDALDIDEQKSAEGTGWGLHWPTVGKNHLHDPKGVIGAGRRIDGLTDEQIGRLRGPQGQVPRRIIYLLRLAAQRKVRVELELKAVISVDAIRHWLSDSTVHAMNKAGRLQFKALAALPNAVKKLRHAHLAGGTTILSFNKYDGAGIYKSRAWPVTDYVRGTPKWR